MSERFIPYGRQSVDDDDVRAVAEALRSDYLTTGPLVRRFEEDLERVTGAAHAVVVNSGTAALHAAYYAAGLGAGDEIVTSPLTFTATANVALHLGAAVRFADVEPDTGNLDPGGLEEALGERTRVVVPVDFAGHPADYDAIGPLAERHGLLVVADGAHSLGGEHRGRPVGTLADLTATSFHPVKPITTGEGGAVLTGREDFAARARAFRNHGFVELPPGGAEPPWHYELSDPGHNFRLPDLNCALGSSQLRRLASFVGRRREIAARYSEAFADLEALTLPVERPGVRSSWHLYVVQVVERRRRRAFFDRLRELRLGVQVHYIPVHLLAWYRRLGYRPGQCPRAEDRSERSVSLPIFPALADDDVASVIERVRRAAAETL